MTSVEIPRFLVATNDGLLALFDSDDFVSLSPAAASVLVVPIGADTYSNSGRALRQEWVQEGRRIKFRCPMVMCVGSGRVWLHSGTLEQQISLTGEQLAMLATAETGFPADRDTVETLGSILESGYMGLSHVGGDTDSDVAGYLRPLAEGVKVDEVGEPAKEGLVPVYSVCTSHIAGIPLALGMLGAALRSHEGGRLEDHFDFRPVRRETATTLEEMSRHPVPSVVLFSNYIWSVEENLDLSAQVKVMCPGSIVIHGGPSTPRYEEDVRSFLSEHSEIDVLVNREGEVTIVEIMSRLASGLSVDSLVGVPGTVVRSSDGSIHFASSRERLADLSVLPSAYLSGMFDHLDGGLLDLMPIETNRGCPYSCAFCDWGSATMSRVRTFPLDRIYAELEWIAERDVSTLFIADANFGMLPRDLEIAKYIADLYRRRGAPRVVLVSFAKNQTLRAAEIVKAWIDAGITTEGSIALQTTSSVTLDTINRKNILVERYDELIEEFRVLGLPMAVDLMLGLPGSTVDSFAADLQKCIDGELTARIYPAIVLPNSPMNSPEYKAANQIRIDENGVVIGSSSFDDDAYEEMLRLRRIYRAGDHFGVLRHLARWAQYDCGVPATEFYRAIDSAVRQAPSEWPNLHWISRHFPRFTVPPPDWQAMLGEARKILVDELGLPESSAMDCALAVQSAHLPWPGAEFPRTLALSHDYVAWFNRIYSSRAEGDGAGGPSLHEYGPGRIVVEDPRGICSSDLSGHMRFHPHPDVDNVMLNEFWIADDWELASPVMRLTPQVLLDEPSASASSQYVE